MSEPPYVVQQFYIADLTDQLLWKAITRARYEEPQGHLRISPLDYERLWKHCTRPGDTWATDGRIASLFGIEVVIDFDQNPGWMVVAVQY